MNPHQVTKDFEHALCEYTGAPFAVTTNSCTMAILLAVAWHLRAPGRVSGFEPDGTGYASDERAYIEIPNRTYISVPMSIIHAGGRPTFRDENWLGCYRLRPLLVWDSARWFTKGMYSGEGPSEGAPAAFRNYGPGHMACVSFHASKTLGLEQGGAILHDNPEADAWLRRARFDGRYENTTPALQAACEGKNGERWQLGWHCYMNPSTAAQGILRLHSLPRHNEPLPNDEYPDLSTMEIFR